MGRDVQIKGLLFSESFRNRGMFHPYKSEKRFKNASLEKGSCPYGNGMVNFLNKNKSKEDKVSAID